MFSKHMSLEDNINEDKGLIPLVIIAIGTVLGGIYFAGKIIYNSGIIQRLYIELINYMTKFP